MKQSFVYLLAILLLALVLRIYQLDKVPSALFGDEVDVGYQAYSLLKTGQDLYGNSWPTLIHSLSEYRAPLFIYSAVPFVALFGLNEWGVRLSAVFFGVLGVLGVFMLTKLLFNQRIGLLAASFMAISPWHIQYSRAAFEVTMLLSFMIFATYFFIKGLDKRYFIIISAILFGLTPYIYSTSVVFMPFLILVLMLIYGKSLKSKLAEVSVAILIMLVVLSPYAYQTIIGKSGERFSVISVFTNQGLNDKVILAQKQENLRFGLQRIFHNKPLEWSQQISMNYLRAFSPEFLFLQGDPNSRHSIHDMGQMYYFELILLLTGVWVLLSGNGGGNEAAGRQGKWLILGWLAVSPLPASLTYDGGFHATRNFLMLLPLLILVSLGSVSVWEKLSKNKSYLLGVLIVLAIFNVTFFLHRYFINYPAEQWRAWHYGFKESMQYVKENGILYNKVLVNNTYEPSLIRFLFWTKYDPNLFHRQFRGDQSIKNITTGFDGFSLEGKYFFGKVNGPFEKIMDIKTLYVASARDDITNPATLYDPNVRLLKTVNSPTGEPIFYIITGTHE